MKRVLSALILTSLLAVPLLVTAQGEPTPPGDIEDILITIRGILWGAFTIFAVIMFIYAGILFFTAGGDPEKAAKAKSAVIFGVAGIAIAILGYGIVEIIKGIMGA